MSWEPLDGRNGRNEVRDFHGVFDANGYSSQPMAIFETKKDAERWIRMDSFMRRAHEKGDVCICVVRLLSGAVWNSTDAVPREGPDPCGLRDGFKVGCQAPGIGERGHCAEHEDAVPT